MFCFRRSFLKRSFFRITPLKNRIFCSRSNNFLLFSSFLKRLFFFALISSVFLFNFLTFFHWQSLVNRDSKFSIGFLQRNRSNGNSLSAATSLNRTLPEVIIFGARKCGTRALLQFLNAHPQIVSAQTEVHFFDRNFERGFEWYRYQMPPALPRQLTVEKTPSYFVTHATPGRVKAMNKTVKLILIVREPVTRILSDYAQVWAKRLDNRNSTLPPLQALVLDEYTNSVNLNFKPAWVSVYHHHLSKWLQHFPLHQIHVVDGDTFTRNPSSELAKVEQFLGISPYLTPEMFVFNQTKGFFCLRSQLKSHSSQLQRFETPETKCLGNSKGRKHPKISNALTQKLRLFYKPHNRLFFKLINETFDW